MLAAVPACAAGHDRATPTPATAPRIEARESSSVARAHPGGPEADEVTRQPPRNEWATAASVLWPTGGRHPVWRGCQHVYNPALSSYLFGGTQPAG
jgi:hypothetical protein